MRFTAFAATAVFATAANAWTITNPSADRWWVGNSVNLLAWNCQDSDSHAQFSIVIFGPGSLAEGQTIVSIQDNFDCSINIPPAAYDAGTGYKIGFANPINRTELWTTSDEFEIKAQGSAYPTSETLTQAPPTGTTGTESPSGTETASQTGAAAGRAAIMGPLNVGPALAAGAAALFGSLLF